MISATVATEGGIFNIISAYAPQQGREEADKDRFTGKFEDLEEHTNKRTWPWEHTNMGSWESMERVIRRAIEDGDMASEIQTWTESWSRQRAEEEKIREDLKRKSVLIPIVN